MTEYTAAMEGTVNPVDVLQGGSVRSSVDMAVDQVLNRVLDTGSPSAKIRMGVVQSFNSTNSTASVTIAGSTTVVPGVPCIGSPALSAGQTVVLVSFGPSYAILGTLGGASASTGGGGEWEVGDVKLSGRPSTAMAKWLLCDGTYVSQTTYSDLYAQLGHSNSNGVDPGNGTFRLPDFRNRYPIGAGYNTALGSNDGASDGTGRTTGMSHYHSHTQADLSGDGNHSHGIAGATSSATNKAASGTATVALLPVSTYDGHNHGGSTTGTGVHSHATPDVDSNSALSSGNTNHPYQSVNFFIKALP